MSYSRKLSIFQERRDRGLIKRKKFREKKQRYTVTPRVQEGGG